MITKILSYPPGTLTSYRQASVLTVFGMRSIPSFPPSLSSNQSQYIHTIPLFLYHQSLISLPLSSHLRTSTPRFPTNSTSFSLPSSLTSFSLPTVFNSSISFSLPSWSSFSLPTIFNSTLPFSSISFSLPSALTSFSLPTFSFPTSFSSIKFPTFSPADFSSHHNHSPSPSSRHNHSPSSNSPISSQTPFHFAFSSFFPF